MKWWINEFTGEIDWTAVVLIGSAVALLLFWVAGHPGMGWLDGLAWEIGGWR